MRGKRDSMGFMGWGVSLRTLFGVRLEMEAATASVWRFKKSYLYSSRPLGGMMELISFRFFGVILWRMLRSGRMHFSRYCLEIFSILAWSILDSSFRWSCWAINQHPVATRRAAFCVTCMFFSVRVAYFLSPNGSSIIYNRSSEGFICRSDRYFLGRFLQKKSWACSEKCIMLSNVTPKA